MNNNDIDDLPEMTEEILNELKVTKNVDLHLGAAEVKRHDYIDWWVKKHGPKPPGAGIIALDILIGLLALVAMDLIIISWMHVFS